jgi:uncharacterized protein with NRDE domain
MCLVALALGAHRRFPFVLAANRDEFHDRPTAAAAPWADAPHVVGGRDLRAGGSWLALGQQGAVAAITNFRDPTRRHPSPRSRGHLVGEFLRARLPAEAFARDAAASGDAYDGFNLLLADGAGAWYVSNRGERPRHLAPGIHALSNHLLGTPWPKVRKAAQTLRESGSADDDELEAALFAMLADASPAPDEELPETGIGLEWERRLAPVFIRSDGYGTRSSSVILSDRTGYTRFVERTFDRDGRLSSEARFEIPLDRCLWPAT